MNINGPAIDVHCIPNVIYYVGISLCIVKEMVSKNNFFVHVFSISSVLHAANVTSFSDNCH